MAGHCVSLPKKVNAAAVRIKELCSGERNKAHVSHELKVGVFMAEDSEESLAEPKRPRAVSGTLEAVPGIKINHNNGARIEN